MLDDGDATVNRAEEFRTLHAPGRATPLLLRQARDGRSARMLEEAGADAIGVSVAALAWVNGLRNGGLLSPQLLRDAVARVTAEVAVPVSVDFDAAPAADPRWLDDAVAAAIAAGAAGVDLADGDAPPAALAARITAARDAAAKAGVDLFVTARTDVYLRGLASVELAIPASIDRGRSYIDAGADAVAVPGVADSLHIRSIASALQMPVSVLVHPRLPAPEVLAAWGVRRVGEAASEVRWERTARQVAA
jgi:2-methylisocitrate lyase-like PEP mutase family enzyme